jgi:hypothetical protein
MIQLLRRLLRPCDGFLSLDSELIQSHKYTTSRTGA